MTSRSKTTYLLDSPCKNFKREYLKKILQWGVGLACPLHAPTKAHCAHIAMVAYPKPRFAQTTTILTWGSTLSGAPKRVRNADSSRTRVKPIPRNLGFGALGQPKHGKLSHILDRFWQNKATLGFYTQNLGLAPSQATRALFRAICRLKTQKNVNFGPLLTLVWLCRVL